MDTPKAAKTTWKSTLVGWLVFAAVFLVISTASSWLPGLLHAVNPFHRWTKFTSPEGRFSIDFPVQPERQTMTGRTTDPRFTEMVFYLASPGRDIAYVAGYSDEFEDTLRSFSSSEILDAARDGAVAQSKGRLDAEYLISKGGFPGRNLRVSGPGHAVQHLEIYLVGGRKYVLGVTAASSAGIFSRDVRWFFDSFRIATNQSQ